MVTIASLVFSVTVLTLTVASQQLGPRLLEWFMSDRANQFILSYFVSLFVFSLLSIGVIRTGDDPYNAYLPVMTAILLTVFGIVFLIFFVHRAANSIQSDNVIARTSERLRFGIEQYLAREGDRNEGLQVPDERATVYSVESRTTGYVQAIGESALAGLAEDSDVLIRVRCEPGDFILKETVLADIEGLGGKEVSAVADELAGKIREQVVTGPKRTPNQDVVFGLRGLVEIAARALSPGINDPYTAITCIDYLTAGLALLVRQGIKPPVLLDDEGLPRLVASRPTLDLLLQTAFSDIRQQGKEHEQVLRRLVQALAALAKCSDNRDYLQDLQNHLSLMRTAIASAPIEDQAKQALEELAVQTASTIGGRSARSE
jgi:uncharacterized membrane protein